MKVADLVTLSYGILLQQRLRFRVYGLRGVPD